MEFGRSGRKVRCPCDGRQRVCPALKRVGSARFRATLHPRSGSQSWNWHRFQAIGAPDRPAGPVGADGRVDAATGLRCLHDHRVQGFAHAVQALEFRRGRLCRPCAGWRDGVGVMGGELRIDAVGDAQRRRALAM